MVVALLLYVVHVVFGPCVVGVESTLYSAARQVKTKTARFWCSCLAAGPAGLVRWGGLGRGVGVDGAVFHERLHLFLDLDALHRVADRDVVEALACMATPTPAPTTGV